MGAEGLGLVEKEVVKLKAGEGNAKALVNLIHEFGCVVSGEAKLLIQFRPRPDVFRADELRQHLAQREIDIVHAGERDIGAETPQRQPQLTRKAGTQAAPAEGTRKDAKSAKAGRRQADPSLGGLGEPAVRKTSSPRPASHAGWVPGFRRDEPE